MESRVTPGSQYKTGVSPNHFMEFILFIEEKHTATQSSVGTAPPVVPVCAPIKTTGTALLFASFSIN
jgi:hypothetical protein